LVIACFLFAPVPFGGSYMGRVVDVQTGRPLPGVVVVGYWTYTMPAIGDSATECLDAREAITDEKGEFGIPAIKGLFYGMIGEFNIVVYKVGYQKRQFWVSKDWQTTMRDKCSWEDGRGVIPMKVVAKERLMEEGNPPLISCGRRDGKPLQKYNNVRKEYRRARGLKP
jgi:hypothetical protein